MCVELSHAHTPSPSERPKVLSLFISEVQSNNGTGGDSLLEVLSQPQVTALFSAGADAGEAERIVSILEGLCVSGSGLSAAAVQGLRTRASMFRRLRQGADLMNE